VLEQKFPRGEIYPLKEQKEETELLNTLEEDLCKVCTKPTLRQSVERQPFEGYSKIKECTCREIGFKFVSSRG
jgi:hypothetical protein